MAKFLVTTQNQTITKELVEAEDETAARQGFGIVLETVSQNTTGTNVEPYSSLVKAKGIVDASGNAVA